ncbi:MAG: ester cyclase [Desulfuromonadaceae bacterium]|nr:ester cyclase [Desulfuromonadaceae bacterium]
MSNLNQSDNNELEERKTLNIAVIKRLFSEGFTGGHEDVLDEIFDPSLVFEDPSLPPGIEGVKAIVRKNNHSFAGWHFILHEIVAEEDRVAVRWTGSGTHVNPFLGEKPTNKLIKLEGISIYYLNRGRIHKDSVVVDNLGFLHQLGVIGDISMIENSE